MLNQFWTGQCQYEANSHGGQMLMCPQIITDIVESCPLTKFAAAGLQQLYSADDKAVMWLKDIAMKAIVQ